MFKGKNTVSNGIEKEVWRDSVISTEEVKESEKWGT